MIPKIKKPLNKSKTSSLFWELFDIPTHSVCHKKQNPRQYGGVCFMDEQMLQLLQRPLEIEQLQVTQSKHELPRIVRKKQFQSDR